MAGNLPIKFNIFAPQTQQPTLPQAGMPSMTLPPVSVPMQSIFIPTPIVDINRDIDLSSIFKEKLSFPNIEKSNLTPNNTSIAASEIISPDFLIPDIILIQLWEANIIPEEQTALTYYGQKPMSIIDTDEDFQPEKLPPFLGVIKDFEHPNNNQYFLFHKKASVKTIEHNKEFIIQRLGLDRNISSEEILNILTSDPSILTGCIKGNTHDLVGIMLGYPKYSSIIFQLDRESGLSRLKNNNMEDFKQVLKKQLYSKNTVYSSFNDAFKREISEVIDRIKELRVGKNNYFQFVQYVDEPEEIQRINSSIERFIEIAMAIALKAREKDDEITLDMELEPSELEEAPDKMKSEKLIEETK